MVESPNRYESRILHNATKAPLIVNGFGTFKPYVGDDDSVSSKRVWKAFTPNSHQDKEGGHAHFRLDTRLRGYPPWGGREDRPVFNKSAATHEEGQK